MAILNHYSCSYDEKKNKCIYPGVVLMGIMISIFVAIPEFQIPRMNVSQNQSLPERWFSDSPLPRIPISSLKDSPSRGRIKTFEWQV